MKKILIETDSLTKHYGKFIALDNVCLQLKEGEIYGLIGKNGAGKTTLMRTLVGLSIPTAGSITLFGKEHEKNIQIEQKNIGCMIENPSIVPYMTARQNLQLHQILRGIKKTDCKAELELVGLSADLKKKAKDFSLGMKQRLGIAIALLSNPQIVILDEPINGLDPIGVTEIRNLIIDLCKNKNITILISSHNLPELYQVATQYIFIDSGKIVKSMSLEELEKESNPHLLIGCKQLDNLINVLKSILHTNNYKAISDTELELYDYLTDIEYVSRVLSENDIVVTNLSYQEETLENYFLSLVGGAKNA